MYIYVSTQDTIYVAFQIDHISRYYLCCLLGQSQYTVSCHSYCNEHGTIYAISSDFGDRMTTQSMGLMVLLSEHF